MELKVSLPELQNEAYLQAIATKRLDADRASLEIHRTTEIVLALRADMLRAGVALYTGLGVSAPTAQAIVERILCEGVR